MSSSIKGPSSLTPDDFESIWSEKYQPTFDTALISGSISYVQHMRIYTLLYNLSTSNQRITLRGLLYEKIDSWLASVTKDICVKQASDWTGIGHHDFVKGYLQRYEEFCKGMKLVDHFCNFMNRHWIPQRIDNGEGWYCSKEYNTRDPVPRALKGEEEALRIWDNPDSPLEIRAGGNLAAIRSKAQAASALDKIVPVYQMGLRRWRVEVAMPLLQKSESENSGAMDQIAPLAMAIDKCIEEGAKDSLLALDRTLDEVGIRANNSVRETLRRAIV